MLPLLILLLLSSAPPATQCNVYGVNADQKEIESSWISCKVASDVITTLDAPGYVLWTEKQTWLGKQWSPSEVDIPPFKVPDEDQDDLDII
jgi:hypothetical protein